MHFEHPHGHPAGRHGRPAPHVPHPGALTAPAMHVVTYQHKRPTAAQIHRHRQAIAVGFADIDEPIAPETPAETADRRLRALVYTRFGARGVRRAMTTTVMPHFGMGDMEDSGLGSWFSKAAKKVSHAVKNDINVVKAFTPAGKAAAKTLQKVDAAHGIQESQSEASRKLFHISRHSYNNMRTTEQVAAGVAGAAVLAGGAVLAAPLLFGGGGAAAAGGTTAAATTTAAAGTGLTGTITGITGAVGAGYKVADALGFVKHPPKIAPPPPPLPVYGPPDPTPDQIQAQQDAREEARALALQQGADDDAAKAAADAAAADLARRQNTTVHAGLLDGMSMPVKIGLGLGMVLLVLQMTKGRA